MTWSKFELVFWESKKKQIMEPTKMAPDMLHKKGNTNTGFIFLPYTFSKVHVKEKKSHTIWM